MPGAQRAERPILVAAPVPLPARYGGRPVYFTDVVVRSHSPSRNLEETFGGVVGYTLVDSMSGGVALRKHLQTFASPQRPRLYRKTVGGFVNARNIIEALATGTIDVGPLDSYYHDLLKRNEPAFAAQVRQIATTAAMPIPPLIATAVLSPADLAALRKALLAVPGAPELSAVLERLQLKGFALADSDDYKILDDMARSLDSTFESI